MMGEILAWVAWYNCRWVQYVVRKGGTILICAVSSGEYLNDANPLLSPWPRWQLLCVFYLDHCISSIRQWSPCTYNAGKSSLSVVFFEGAEDVGVRTPKYLL